MPHDAAQIKEGIVSFIRSNGPSLPVQIAKSVNLSILFASAFLSELFGEKQIRMSYLRVGSSPLYFLDEQEPALENFSQYLKSKGKEAYALLKENKILKDSEQHPAIRVALREIKDYAIPFHKDGEMYWRYFLFSEQQVSEYLSDKDILQPTQKETVEIKQIEEKEETKKMVEQNSKEGPIKEEVKEEETRESQENIQHEKKKVIKKEKVVKKTASKKSSKPDKKNENFFNKIKESLAKEGIEIIDIKDFKNDEAIILVNNKGKEELKFFFNKKKITEKEILSCFKKAQANKLDYSISFFGEPSKKLEELISAIKGLSKIDKIKE